jgi:hypothetical protein
MPTPPPRSPAERFAALLLCISQAVGKRTGWGLHGWVIALITNRVRGIKQRFARLAARIAAGSYVPRQAAVAAAATTPSRPPIDRPPIDRKPRQKNPLPQKFGWLAKLIPEAVCYGSQLEHLFRDPEMAALLEAAPEPMRRTLRPLCHMLGVRLPPPIALPAKPRKPRVRRPKPPEPPLHPPHPPGTPEWLRTMPGGKPWPLSRMLGRRRRFD